MSIFPCSFGSVRAPMARDTLWHSPLTMTSHPLDIGRAAATATSGAFARPAVGRYHQNPWARAGPWQAQVRGAAAAAQFNVAGSEASAVGWSWYA